MRKHIQRQLLELLDTVQAGIGFLAVSDSDAAASLRGDCRMALKQIAAIIENAEISSAAFCREKLCTVSEDLENKLTSNRLQIALQRIESVQKRLQKEPVHIEIAFFPYKLSMWDCMESVWKAAEADPYCDSYVVPIPYYDRNPDQSLGTMHYEGRWFPPEIPVVDYKSYDVAARKPDICYIHNPYDEFNRVTSVDPRFYSYELKKHTDHLVYIPYYIVGCVTDIGVGITLSLTSAYRHADHIIAQSEVMKKGLIDLGIKEKRILAIGNPKFDAVLNHKRTESYPSEWDKKLNGKTTFLINTSLTALLSHTERWLHWIQQMIMGILDTPDCAVIWRPHPLMEATLKSMRPNQVAFYLEMKNKLLSRENFVQDTQGDCLPAFDASHALLSDKSSLEYQYGATGKPVLCFDESRMEGLQAKYPMTDYSSFYFLKDDVSVAEFVDMVRQGKDPMKEKRMAGLNASIINLDGTAGSQIHKIITKYAVIRNDTK